MGMRKRPFTEAEFATRVEAARRVAVDEGWDGLLVVGRGGGTVDRLAQLWYLTDAYASFPTIPDLDGSWWDRGFAAAVITPDAVVVCGDSDTLAEGGAVADEVKLGNDLPALITDVLTARGLGGAHLGLGGADVLTFRQRARLAERLPALQLSDADARLMVARMIKSEAEIAAMRAAAHVGAEALQIAMRNAQPGTTEAGFCAPAVAHVVASGAHLANAFAYTFGPDADDPRKRMPTYDHLRPLGEGDLATVDISGTLDGYFFDGARSRVVGADATPAQQRAIDLVRETVDLVVAELQPGRHIADAAKVGFELLERNGYSDLTHDRFQALGHGLGLGFEQPWVRTDSELTIEVGMIIAIEKFCAIDGTGATFERTVAITPDGPVDLEPVNDTW